MSTLLSIYAHEEDMMADKTKKTDTNRTCNVCDASMEGRAPQARYCSTHCMRLASDQRQGRRLTHEPANCGWCEVKLTTTDPRASYCSASCRRKAWSHAQKDDTPS